MTVETPYVIHDYSPGSAMAAEAVPWPFLTAAHLRVTHIADADGAETVLTLGDDYIVLGSGPAGTGTVTAADEWPDDDVFRVERVTPAEQKATILSGQPLPADDVNKQLDRMALIAQERDAALARALLVPVGETPLTVEDIAEGQVAGRVGDKLVGVPNGAAEFAAEVEAAKSEIAGQVDAANETIDEKVEQVEEDAQTVATLAGQVATNAGTVATQRDEAVQAATDSAAALALAQALMVGDNLFSEPLIADAIAAGIAAVADGVSFAASGDDVTHWELRRRNGSGSDLLWKMPKAILPGGALPTLTYERSLTIADAAVTAAGPLPILTSFEGPAGMWGTARVPSNSVDPIAIGTVFCHLHMDANPVRWLSDETGEAIITPVVPGMTALVNQGARAWLVKKATNEWLLFGELSPPPASAYSLKVFLDPSAAHTRKQERTGASATTPAGANDPVGTWANLGSFRGYATASADARRPLTKVDGTGRSYIETDGAASDGDFLVLPDIPVDYEKLNLFIAFRPTAYKFASGIIALAPTNFAGDVSNTAFAISQNAVYPVAADFAVSMGVSPNRLSASIQGLSPRRARVWEWRCTDNAAPKTITIDGLEIASTGQPTSIAALGNVTALGSATVRLVIGANAGNLGQGGAIQHSPTEYYGIALTDEVLTPEQRQAIRTYLEVKAYEPVPVYPDFADLTALVAARTVLQTEVFGGAPPTDIATKAVDVTPPVPGLTNLASVHKLTIPGEADTNIKPRLWTPNSPRSDVVAFIWAGHNAGWNSNGISTRALQPYLTAGVRVVTMVLPDGVNDFTSGGPAQHFANQTAYAKWARQYWVAANMVLDDTPGAELQMTGISGGGWATGLCAALDPRIAVAVPFVGIIPEWFTLNVDYEQWLTQISAVYLELFLMASADGRRFIQVLHEGDFAGFNRYCYSSRPPYAEGMADLAAAFGGYFELRWFNYIAHEMNADSTALLLAELP